MFKSEAFASYASMTLTLMPEPTRLALLATGLLGLIALSRLRRG